MKPGRPFAPAALRLVTGAMIWTGATSAAVSAAGGDDWQQRRLFSPTTQERAAEQQGRVVIYDGVKDVEVARAMDEQFERVESMMFIRTQITDRAGTVVDSEDEGCD